jgi:hypothetical protein
MWEELMDVMVDMSDTRLSVVSAGWCTEWPGSLYVYPVDSLSVTPDIASGRILGPLAFASSLQRSSDPLIALPPLAHGLFLDHLLLVFYLVGSHKGRRQV